MKSIEKINITDANKIIDPFLNKAKVQKWFLTGDIYRHFTNQEGKRRLVDSVLLPEQDCRCCYCMKRFNPHDDPDATIEHLIPRGTLNGNAFVDYFSMDYPGLNADNICHTDDYKIGHCEPAQYPHHVAYHNFTIACSVCNGRRAHSSIGFPFLLPPNRQYIRYKRETGKIELVGELCPVGVSIKLISLIKKVELNSPYLKAIRALWFYGKDHPTEDYSTPNTIQNLAHRKELIYNAVGLSMENDPHFNLADLNSFIALETEGGWSEVLKYDYFASI